ncbi:MAG: PQQ-like beta-propeller repeat protein [Planctomycetes bacterium]|nr:PQQ-like beta-propeller repeat protein [Planctomycetota bacterium]
MPCPPVCLLPLLFASLSGTSEPSDWPGFRGPGGRNVVAARAFPPDWSAERNLAWSVEIAGGGLSSPVVVGERVFVTTAVGNGDEIPQGMSGGLKSPMSRGGGGPKPTLELSYRVLCLSLADGKTLWEREVGKNVPAFAVHPSNSFATESPTTDGQRVFAVFGALGRVVALDLEGKLLWRAEIGVQKTSNDFGWAISPIATQGLVLVQSDNDESGYLVAFDAATGEERWRDDRGKGTSWGSPVLWPAEGGEQLVCCGEGRVVAYDPKSGEQRWRVEGFGGSFSSSPAWDEERLYFGNSGPGRPGPLVAVPKSARGVIDLGAEKPAVAWSVEKAGPGFSSPVVAGGFVYVLGSAGVLACYDAKSGERLYRERLPDAATIVASPWVAGDELFVLDEVGKTFVVKLGKSFEIARTSQLDGIYWATPSIAGNALLLRDARKLHCIRG